MVRVLRPGKKEIVCTHGKLTLFISRVTIEELNPVFSRCRLSSGAKSLMEIIGVWVSIVGKYS
jgi:hypothetical protein